MALSNQNKIFLALLNRLGIDVKQFSDKTFDGLFDNVPEDINYFFNWFIENITPDNVLTQSEQATYFQLESNQLIPTEDEMNNALLSHKPGFKNLLCLNINYINNLLIQDLGDLTKNYEMLSRIFADLETNYSDIKKKQNNKKEEIRMKKKQMNIVKERCHKGILHFASKMDDVIVFLMKDSHFLIDINSFNNFLKVENDIFNKIKTCKLLRNKIFSSLKSDLLLELEEDLGCVDISVIISEGLLKEKKTNLEFLRDFLQKKSLEKSFNYNNLIRDADSDAKLMENIKILEQEVFKKMKTLSHYKIKTESDQYKLEKISLSKCYMTQFNICNNYLTANLKVYLWLFHILLKCITSLKDTLSLKKQLYTKLNEYERNFSNDITTVELKKQRFKEVSMQQSRDLLVSALKNDLNFKENTESNEDTFTSIYELLLNADHYNFVSYGFRNDLQSLIKIFFENNLCGPTSQLLFAPVELSNKLQNCEEYEREVDQMIKRLATKFVDAKIFISKSDRTKSLSWIKILRNKQFLLE